MKTKKSIYDTLSVKNQDKIPNVAFKIMTFVMSLFDFFGNHSNKKFKTLNLKPGQTVIDYGCGPARYIKNASDSVGDNGRVIAVDVHPLAIKNVNEKISSFGLKNVEAVLADAYSTTIPDETADVVYALDMLHMVKQPDLLFKELHRLIKPEGIILMEDGHQPRSETIKKINNSNLFIIIEENKHHVKCQRK